jgi:Pathogenicity locus
MGSITKLPLTTEEKAKLRKARIRMSEIHHFNTEEISQVLNISSDKARKIKGLAEFQSIPSIGYKLAERLVLKLNILSLEEMKDQNPPQLFDQLEQQLGVWTDSCVEDQIRCVIHYANDRNSTKQWFDFTEERKIYRELNGFPANRPKKAWYD